MEDKSSKMTRLSKTKKMTLEKLAVLTQNEFSALGKKFATKEDIESFKNEVKDEVRDFKEEVKEDMHENMGKFLTKADSISGKLDKLLEEGKAGTALYKRHEKRISTLESAAISK